MEKSKYVLLQGNYVIYDFDSGSLFHMHDDAWDVDISVID